MSDRKFIYDRPSASIEKIKASKDFDKLFADYKSLPKTISFGQHILWSGMGMLVCVALLGVMDAGMRNSEPSLPDENAAIVITHPEKSENILKMNNDTLLISGNGITPNSTEKKAPKIRKADKNKFHFKLKIDPVEHPELTGYKNVEFEVASEFSPKYYKTKWNNIKVEKTTMQGLYNVTLTKGDSTQVVKAWAVEE